ncbi:MAG TPA: DUF2892 domain-containing protein [Gemmatimonadales bacterium]
MRNNVGRLDAAIRWTLAAVFFAVAIMFRDVTVVTFGSALVALVLAGTAATRSCPLYAVLGLRTDHAEDGPQKGEGHAH